MQPRRSSHQHGVAAAFSVAAVSLVATWFGLGIADAVTAESTAVHVASALPANDGIAPEPAITALSPTLPHDAVFIGPAIGVVPAATSAADESSGISSITPPEASGDAFLAGGATPSALTAKKYCTGKLSATTSPASPSAGVMPNDVTADIAPFSTSGSDVTAFLTAANLHRAQIGAPPLVWNGTLATFAAGWSDNMAAAQNAHESWLWGSAEWYAGIFRHSGGPYAENIAVNYGYSDPVNVAQSGWMLSTGHCRNIMNPAYTQFGAGKTQANDGRWYFTEEFSW